MQIQTTLKLHVSPVGVGVTKRTNTDICWYGCRENKPLYTVSENVSQISYCGNQYTSFSSRQATTAAAKPKLLKVKLCLPILLLGIYPQASTPTHHRDTFASCQLWLHAQQLNYGSKPGMCQQNCGCKHTTSLYTVGLFPALKKLGSCVVFRKLDTAGENQINTTSGRQI